MASQDAPLACAPSQQTPSPHNSWRMGHTRLGSMSPPSSPTRSWMTYGRSQHLREKVSLALLGQKSLLPPPGTWSQESLHNYILFSQSLLLGTPKYLSPYISAVCPIQDARETHLHLCRSNHHPTIPARTSGLSTWEVDCRSGHPLTDTWSAWSWRWLAIAASPWPPERTNGAGYSASKMTFHRDLSWHPFSSTTTPQTCQPPSPENMHMLMT